MDDVDNDKSIEVERFSFGNFLNLKSKNHNVIIVKLDMESAEYVVLEDIINNANQGSKLLLNPNLNR
jgi:hypothetical protein